MLRTYSKNIAVTANTPIVFNINKILTNNSVSHSAGSGNIIINAPGYYAVNLDLSGTIATTGEAIIQLYADGTAIPDALIKKTFTASESSDTSFSTIIKATPGITGKTVTLTVLSNVDLTLSDIALGMNRLA